MRWELVSHQRRYSCLSFTHIFLMGLSCFTNGHNPYEMYFVMTHRCLSIVFCILKQWQLSYFYIKAKYILHMKTIFGQALWLTVQRGIEILGRPPLIWTFNSKYLILITFWEYIGCLMRTHLYYCCLPLTNLRWEFHCGMRLISLCIAWLDIVFSDAQKW